MNMPADWAIEEAIQDAELKTNTAWVKYDPSGCTTIIQLARMIEKYEPHRKPVDPALAIVRELFASNFKFIGGADITVQEYRDGHYDDKPVFQDFLAKYKELHP